MRFLKKLQREETQDMVSVIVEQDADYQDEDEEQPDPVLVEKGEKQEIDYMVGALKMSSVVRGKKQRRGLERIQPRQSGSIA